MKQNKLLIVGMLVLPILLSACGGAGGSSTAKTEVVNGITVPTAPDPTLNAATLAGVDSNNNGVRDDVERKVAVAATNQSEFDASMQKAKAYQNTLISYTKNVTRAELITHQKTIACSGNVSSEIKGILLDSILDNDARRLAYTKANTLIGGISGGEVTCD